MTFSCIRSLSVGFVSATLLAACTGTQSTTNPSDSAPPAPSEPAVSESVTPDVATSATTACTPLPTNAGWYGDNHAKLQAMIDKVGKCGGDGDVAKGAPLALFDWDNTVVKNDIGDAMTFWMLKNGKVLQPERWKDVSTFITDDAVDALTKACGDLAKPGEPIPTNEEKGFTCADEIISAYSDGETKDGKTAFKDFDARRIEPHYAFAAQLLAGYTDDEIVEFASKSREENLAAAEGTKQTVGTTEVTGWVRYYDQIEELIETLNAHGFDTRVVSASAEPVVKAWATPMGFTDDKLMGVKVVAKEGKRGTKLVSCGGDEQSMTYIEGKRCRVNEEIFGITGADAFKPAPMDKRPAFGAGDSDTDISFMIDATELRLAINRNKTELMCHAYDNEDGKWIINPMFIDPKGKADKPYACATKGEILSNGEMGPLKDIAGKLIEDQEDTIFGKTE